MSLQLTIEKPIVSVHWLQENINAKNIIIFDATMPKIGSSSEENSTKERIPKAVFFDIKNEFSNVNSKYPNTLLNETEFEFKAQNIGVNNNSCIVVYDDLGVYSSPRVWWMFKTFGFTNIAVLNGGLPAWKEAGFLTETSKKKNISKGNFIAKLQSEKVQFTQGVLASINQKICIADARSKERFLGLQLEPRKEVKSGHIPNSVSIPYTKLQENKKMKTVPELTSIFNEVNPEKNDFIFSCGSGITACILALGAELLGNTNYSVYDGSWSEWGSRSDVPVKSVQTPNWTRKEFEAYILLYCAQSNFIETKEERAYIIAKVDERLFNAIHTEIVHDTSTKSLKKIEEYLHNNNYSTREKEELIKDIKNVFFADGTVDKYEKNVFKILQKLLS